MQNGRKSIPLPCFYKVNKDVFRMSALCDIHERNAELYQAYKMAMSERGMTHSRAVEIAIQSPSSRYWVSPLYVYREIRTRLRGYARRYDPVMRRKKPRACKADMYNELWEIYKRLREKTYFKGCSTYFLVSFVVNQRAPHYYLSYREGLVIIE